MVVYPFVVEEKEMYLIGCVLVIQESNDRGWHRLTIGEVSSPVEDYTRISTLDVPEGKFAGTTEFFSNHLPRVFQITTGHVVK